MNTTSGTINVFCNDFDTHNLTLIFGGELYEFIFSETISENIVLNTKSIDAKLLWDEIFAIVEGIDVELWFYDGATWIMIEQSTTDLSGFVLFNNLVMGEYIVCEAGLFTIANNFELTQDIVSYIDDVIIEPIKTILDLEYADSIFGVDYPIDISGLSWTIQLGESIIFNLFDHPEWYDGIIVNNETGIITIYNLYADVNPNWGLILYDYAGYVEYTLPLIVCGVLNEYEIPAKSLEAEFLWSFESEPVANMNFELFFLDGVDWISVDTYISDVNGKIIITEMLPIGTYKFNDYVEFNIVSNDDVVSKQYLVESLAFGKGKDVFNINMFGRHINIFFILWR